MPPKVYRIYVEIVLNDPIPWIPPVYEPLKKAPVGVKYPRAEIVDFTFDGSFKMQISKPLDFPATLLDEFNKVRPIWEIVPLPQGTYDFRETNEDPIILTE